MPKGRFRSLALWQTARYKWSAQPFRMSVKHAAPRPKRRRSPNDLEKRVRWLERHFVRDATTIARIVARHEIGEALAEWNDGGTGVAE